MIMIIHSQNQSIINSNQLGWAMFGVMSGTEPPLLCNSVVGDSCPRRKSEAI